MHGAVIRFTWSRMSIGSVLAGWNSPGHFITTAVLLRKGVARHWFQAGAPGISVYSTKIMLLCCRPRRCRSVELSPANTV